MARHADRAHVQLCLRVMKVNPCLADELCSESSRPLPPSGYEDVSAMQEYVEPLYNEMTLMSWEHVIYGLQGGLVIMT